MEIPTYLKGLYKHWKSHSEHQIDNNQVIKLDAGVLNSIQKFAVKRQNIWERKIKKQKPPLTKDLILQKYKFCNVYRELDRQTIEIHELLKKLEHDLDLWLLNVVFCRFVCNVNTINKVGLLSFSLANNKKVYKKLLDLPSPKYGSAYIFPVSLIMRSSYPTREKFFCMYLPKVMKRCGKIIRGLNNKSVVEALDELLPVFGFNFKFHWTEVLIDVAYQFPKLMNLYDRFPIGPGAKPTMKTLIKGIHPETTCLALTQTTFNNFPYLTYKSKPVLLSSENWEGIGCEYRKYSNLTRGRGRRRLYT